MKYCTNCGQKVNDDAKFCSNCGTSISQNASNTERKIAFDGEIHKCPNCGEVLKAFETVCPNCKFELRGAKSSSAVSELVKKIEELDRKKYDDSFIKSIKRKLDGAKLSPIEEQKISLISNFLIPNTKEDILEFMILSSSHILTPKPSGNISERDELLYKELKKAWKMKFEQAYNKAKVCIKNDEDRAEIEQCYNKTILEPQKKKKKTAKIVSMSITIPIIIVVVIAMFVFLKEENYIKDIETINWDNLAMGDKLPDFGRTKAEVVWDNDNVLILYFYGCNKTEFENYIDNCINFGYNIDVEDDGTNFTAYNAEGYYLHLQYLDWGDNQLTIDLENPKDKDTIIWPASQLVKGVPIPKHLTGEVSLEYDTSYAVYLVGIEKDYFSEYVSLCMENGFNIDYSKSKTYFRGENSNGISITVEYKGFNTLYIWVSD